MEKQYKAAITFTNYDPVPEKGCIHQLGKPCIIWTGQRLYLLFFKVVKQFLLFKQLSHQRLSYEDFSVK